MHRRTWGITYRAAAGVVALTTLLSVPSSSVRAAQRSTPGQTMAWSSSDWNTFSADVTIRTQHQDSGGAKTGIDSLPVRYHWERRQAGSGWKSTITFNREPVQIGQGARRLSIEPAIAIARVEDDEDGSPLRMYASDGRRIAPPSLQQLQQRVREANPNLDAMPPENPADPAVRDSAQTRTARPAAGGRDWIAAFVATPGQKSARRARFDQQFVRRGQVRGFDRFVRPDGDLTREVLADPASYVPVESNLVRGSERVSHIRFSYSTEADGSLVRRQVHVEQAAMPSGERAVIDTEYANVRLERR